MSKKTIMKYREESEAEIIDLTINEFSRREQVDLQKGELGDRAELVLDFCSEAIESVNA